MTYSELIAIVAIIVSGITSLATLAANYYSNKENNRFRSTETEANIIAKRREVVFGERLKAFGETIEKLGDLKFAIRQMIPLTRDIDVPLENETAKNLDLAYSNFISTYNKRRMFFTNDIDDIIIEYSNSSIPLAADKYSLEAMKEWYERTIMIETNIIAMIRELNSFK